MRRVCLLAAVVAVTASSGWMVWLGNSTAQPQPQQDGKVEGQNLPITQVVLFSSG